MDADVVALITEFDCSRTVETGSDLGALALAIAKVHDRRGTGQHTAISARGPSSLFAEATDGLRQAGLLHRVNAITAMSEVALPEMIRDGFEADFALIHGPRRFEDTFLEFLYLDRLLVPSGIMVLAGATERSVDAVLEFAGRARAYELSSPPGAELAVLHKSGGQRGQPILFPAFWGLSGDDNAQAPDQAPENGANGVTPLRPVGTTNGTPLKSTSTRELHLAHARAGELEVRVAELGACLLDAEQRAAELLRTQARLRRSQAESHGLRDQLSLSEAEHERAEAALERSEHGLECITTSASWRLTAPLRVIKALARARVRTGR